MKYVKTNYGIFENQGEYVRGEYSILDPNDNYIMTPGRLINVKDIIKHSDRLDELCDGFYVDRTPYFDITNIYATFAEVIEYAIEKKEKVYGFVKTSRGLEFTTIVTEEGTIILKDKPF